MNRNKLIEVIDKVGTDVYNNWFENRTWHLSKEAAEEVNAKIVQESVEKLADAIMNMEEEPEKPEWEIELKQILEALYTPPEFERRLKSFIRDEFKKMGQAIKEGAGMEWGESSSFYSSVYDFVKEVLEKRGAK